MRRTWLLYGKPILPFVPALLAGWAATPYPFPPRTHTGTTVMFRIAAIIRVVLISLAVLIVIIFGMGIVGTALLITGTPQPCVDRQVLVSPAASQSLKGKWDGFRAQVASGPASVTFNESEVTSRGVEYLKDKDVPLNDLQVYLCAQGYGEAMGTLDVLGRDVRTIIRGSLDLSKDKPRLDVQSIRAGNLPSGVATRIVNEILDRSGVKTLDIKERITGISFSDGEVTLRGQP